MHPTVIQIITVRFELQLFGALIAPFFDCCPGREDLKTSSKVCNPPWTPTLTSNLPAVGGLHVGVSTPHLQLSVARAVSLASTGPATRLRGLRIMIALQVTPRLTVSTRLGDRATLMVSSTRASSARLLAALVGTVCYSRALSTDFPTTVPPIVSLRHFVPLVSCTRAISAPSLSANVIKRTRRLCT